MQSVPKKTNEVNKKKITKAASKVSGSPPEKVSLPELEPPLEVCDDLAKKVVRSQKHGLHFNVGTLSKYIRQGKYSDRIGSNVPVYVSAIMQYISTELSDVCSDVAQAEGKTKVKPRHIMLAIRKDEELNKLVGVDTIFLKCGVNPKDILPDPKKGKAGKKMNQ